MKKITFFLILIISIIFINPTITQAKNYKFYEGEYIDNIWINKYNPKTKETHYQKARFFRQYDTNDFAYCIETFETFNENGNYTDTNNPTNLNNEQKERISQIAHFGYGYKNHTEKKWYAITQFMIWQTANPEGTYYFTDSLNGNKITKFTQEIEEINNLINNYNTLPSIANKEYTVIENTSFTRTDTKKILNNYISLNENATIKNNIITIKELKEGNYTFNFERTDNTYNKPIIFYQSNTSQNLVDTGNIDKKNFKITVKVYNTSFSIKKIDSITKNTIPTGDAELNGAIYELYNENMTKISELKIKDNQANIENISFGKYYIKEKQAGIGYKLDKNIYTIYITSINPKINLELENEVIKSKITINKKFIYNNEWIPEKNISFNIYNSKNQIVKTIKTNDHGICSIELPYGKYTIKQLTTTEGYTKIEPKTINIANEDEQIINLQNYKIKVPNTKTNETFLEKILKLIKRFI